MHKEEKFMFDYAVIKKISPNDVLILNGLIPLAQQAIEAEKLIKETYMFHIGETEIEVWTDQNNYEYITRDGIWQARYLHQEYNVECTADVIFEYFKADFLIKNGYSKEYENSCYTEEGKKAEIFRYFIGFLRKTEDLHEKMRKQSKKL